MFIFLSALPLRVQEEQCHQRGKKLGDSWSFQPASKKTKCRADPSRLVFSHSLVGLSLASREPTKQHFPDFLDDSKIQGRPYLSEPRILTRWERLDKQKQILPASLPENKFTIPFPKPTDSISWVPAMTLILLHTYRQTFSHIALECHTINHRTEIRSHVM